MSDEVSMCKCGGNKCTLPDNADDLCEKDLPIYCLECGVEIVNIPNPFLGGE